MQPLFTYEYVILKDPNTDELNTHGAEGFRIVGNSVRMYEDGTSAIVVYMERVNYTAAALRTPPLEDKFTRDMPSYPVNNLT